MKKLILPIGAAVALLIGAVTLVRSQQTTPSELPGCVYTLAAPTYANRQTAVIRCDINGKIIIQ